MKENNSRLVIKLLFLTILILGTVYLILLANYTFNGNGDIRNDIGRQVLKSVPETFNISIVAIIFLIYGGIVSFVTYHFYRYSRPDVTSGEKISYEKQIAELRHQVELSHTKMGIVKEEVALLSKSLMKSREHHKNYRYNSEINLKKAADVLDRILYFHEEGE